MTMLRYSRAVPLALLLVFVGSTCLTASAQPIPRPWAPEGARTFGVGQSVNVGGLQVQIQGFVSADPVDRVLGSARASAGGLPVAESSTRGRRVVGWLEAGHYITVQAEPAGISGTRGIWSAVPVREALRARTFGRSGPEWFPVGSETSPPIHTSDRSLEGRIYQAFNPQSVEVNADHLQRTLRLEGFELERSSRPTGRPGLDPNLSLMLFRGAGSSQATAVVRRDGAGSTSVILILTRTMDDRP